MGLVVAVLGAVFAFSSGGLKHGHCSSDPLVHVYHPQRLQVVEKCAQITGIVVAWRHEHDGDYHVSMRMDRTGWTNPVNDAKQHGYTVVEFVPLMKRPEFKVGQKLWLLGTKVIDKQHGGWIELHPVFDFKDVTPAGPGAPPAGGPNPAPLAPPTEG